MKPLGFRQANAWLHTWVGLLLGWLLYVVFLTGTLSFFQQEISFWMKPELHASAPNSNTALRALERLRIVAPNAVHWGIDLPSERNPALEIQWFKPGEKIGRRGGERLTLDAASGEPVTVRETRGGSFLYRFHFELYGLPRMLARWIVCVATMLMLVAIVSGVVTHKKIFKDFFTFRPRKGQRSWLDAHNATAVLALPFHFMITYSGLLLFMFILMPWGVNSAYNGDMQAYFDESGGRGGRSVAEQANAQDVSEPERLKPSAVVAMLAQAEQQWPRGVASLQISHPNTRGAIVELREQGGDSLIERGASRRLRFDAATGAPMDDAQQNAVPGANAVYNVFTSLHLIRFAGPPLRWLFFISGLLGTGMIVTGLILWVVKRHPERRKLGRTPFGHRLVEVLNVGAVAGLPVAIAAYFWANRLLPVGLAERSDWEIRVFFLAWALCLVHPLLRPHKTAWIDQLIVGAVLYAGLPLFGLLTPHSGLLSTVPAGNGLLVGMDLTLFASALLLSFAARKLLRHQPAAKVQRKARPMPTSQEASA